LIGEVTGALFRGSSVQAMNWRSRVAAAFVVLALVGCATEVADQAGAQYAPYSPDDNEIRSERGGGDGGGGGGGGM